MEKEKVIVKVTELVDGIKKVIVAKGWKPKIAQAQLHEEKEGIHCHLEIVIDLPVKKVKKATKK